MAYACASDGYVVLRGGLVIPVGPLRLLLDLERRGCRLTRDGDVLMVEPARLVTAEDGEAIRRWKQHLLCLLDYRPPTAA